MSSTFSFSRLGKLITKEFFENSRLYIFSTLALLGLLALVFTFWSMASRPHFEEQGMYFIFLTGLFVSGAIFSSMSFNMLGSKDKGIYWLSVPATHFEKLVCTIFFSTVVFTTVYCLCFFLVKFVAVTFISQYIESTPGSSYRQVSAGDEGFWTMIKYFLLGFLGVQALYLLGSVYFRRYAFIVTTVAGAFMIFVFVYYISRIGDSMFNNTGWNLVSVKKPDTPTENAYLLYTVSSTLKNILEFTVKYAWAPLFWTITWFRLKEKEI